MKTIFYFLLLCFSLETQAQQFNYTWGTIMQKPFVDDDVEIFAITNGYYTVSSKKASLMEFNKKIIIEKFDLNHERKDVVDVTSLPQYDYISTIIVNDKLFVLQSIFEKDNQTNNLLAQEMLSNGKLGAPKIIATINAEKLSRRGRFFVCQSPDKSKLLITTEPAFTKGENEKFDVIILDKNFTVLQKQSLVYPYEFARVIENYPSINNDGQVFIIKRTNTKGPNYPYSLFILQKNNELKEFKIELAEKQKIVSFKSQFSSNGNFLIIGIYTEDGSIVFGGTHFKGLFNYCIDKTGSSKVFATITAFDDTRKNNSIVNLLTDQDGNSFLISEEKIINDRPAPTDNSKPANFFKEPERLYTYLTNSFYIDAFSASGEKKFSQVIKRSYQSENDYGVNNSIFSTIRKNQLLLLYNDSEEKYDGRNRIIVFNPARITVLSNLNKNTGEFIKTEGLFNANGIGGKQNNILLRPSTFYQLDENNFLVRAEKKDFYKMGKLIISE